jgi:flavin-binding protein dodecin
LGAPEDYWQNACAAVSQEKIPLTALAHGVRLPQGTASASVESGLSIGSSKMSSHHTYKKVELVGSSTLGIEDAISNALAEAAKSLRHMDWFEVVETRGHIVDGRVGHYQVTLKVGFRIAAS